ncbi:hypothetical protein NQZ68_034699 [Dissostichus eleginoides]|nr:hypothetical protein NQZ68_034699 [Dissostichus eleginoides]
MLVAPLRSSVSIYSSPGFPPSSPLSSLYLGCDSAQSHESGEERERSTELCVALPGDRELTGGGNRLKSRSTSRRIYSQRGVFWAGECAVETLQTSRNGDPGAVRVPVLKRFLRATFPPVCCIQIKSAGMNPECVSCVNVCTSGGSVEAPCPAWRI